jgi:hypothetical protein
VGRRDQSVSNWGHAAFDIVFSSIDLLFGLSEHLYKLWDLWLALSSSDHSAPNAFLALSWFDESVA